MLIQWNILFVLSFRFDIFDCVGGFHIEGDGFVHDDFHEHLYFIQINHQLKSQLLLNVVIRKSVSDIIDMKKYYVYFEFSFWHFRSCRMIPHQ